MGHDGSGLLKPKALSSAHGQTGWSDGDPFAGLAPTHETPTGFRNYLSKAFADVANWWGGDSPDDAAESGIDGPVWSKNITTSVKGGNPESERDFTSGDSTLGARTTRSLLDQVLHNNTYPVLDPDAEDSTGLSPLWITSDTRHSSDFSSSHSRNATTFANSSSVTADPHVIHANQSTTPFPDYVNIKNISFSDEGFQDYLDNWASSINFNLSSGCWGSDGNATGLCVGRNGTNLTAGLEEGGPDVKLWWAMVLLLFPILTVFGNVLVCLSVYKEKTLRTVTNYFIVSLAVADIMVAVLVMPLAVYVEVRQRITQLGVAGGIIVSTV